MITLSNISKLIGTRVLFQNVSASFQPGNRYGLTGPNGAGKSTLLKIMMKEVEPTTGTVSIPRKTGFLRQNIEPYLHERVVDVVIMGNARLHAALKENDELLSKGDISDAEGMRLGELSEIIMEEDGYEAETHAEELLRGMQIPESGYRKPLGELTKGDQFKVMLCQALFGNPDALLLDEPTNHLDIDSIGWLEEFLHNYTGTLIVVSHDRHFLNAVTTHIADVDFDTIAIYTGNYDAMIATKSSNVERDQKDAQSREKKIAQLSEFVSKFGAGTRSSQATSRQKEIDKLSSVERMKRTNIQTPYIDLQLNTAKLPGHRIVEAKKISKRYHDDGPSIFSDFSFEINKGDKIGLIGNNGFGKTTLLKLIAGIITPVAGQFIPGQNVDIGYLPQDHEELIEKTPHQTAYDYLKTRSPTSTDGEIRSALGKMLFSGDNAFKTLDKLSGGETTRLLIAALILLKPNFLILDEPNNHLDIEAVSALSEALKNFGGTVIISGHDREMIKTVSEKIIALEKDGNKIHPIFYEGPYEEYRLKRKELIARKRK